MADFLKFLGSQGGSWFVFWVTFVGLLVAAPRLVLAPEIASRWFVDAE